MYTITIREKNTAYIYITHTLISANVYLNLKVLDYGTIYQIALRCSILSLFLKIVFKIVY